MEFIKEAVNQGLIKFDSDEKFITYTHQNIKRNFQNPEEKVQAETFCKLILKYGYPEKHIRQYEKVTMGSSVKEADIIVYNDTTLEKPYIVIECKKEEVSEGEFKQAVEQVFSYAQAIAGTIKFVWVTKGNKEEFYKFNKEKNTRTIQSEIPYYGETTIKKYRFAKGGFYKVKGKEADIKTDELRKVNESELTRIFKQAHDALWAGGELNPSQTFDELDKLVFCKIWDERNTKKGEPYQFQIVIENQDDDSKNLEVLKNHILTLYDKGKQKDPEVFNKPLDLTPERIKTIVEYFQGVNFSDTDLDSKGKAFESFIGTYFRGEFGQYFTPRNVMKFTIDVLPITNESKVLDTSCGSGGFLLHCLDKVRRQADKEYDLNNPKETKDHYVYWHDFASKNLYGIEINDQISRVAKMNMIIHDDGHTNVITFDGLYHIDHIKSKTGNKGFDFDSFDFIVTNPPFGSIAKQSEKSYMQIDKSTTPYYDYSLKELNWIEKVLKGKHLLIGRENQSTEILFIEQCHKFLKKLNSKDSLKIKSTKGKLQDKISKEKNLKEFIELCEKDKKNLQGKIKELNNKNTEDNGEEKPGLLKARFKDSKNPKENIETYQNQIEEINEKISTFKEELEEYYQSQKQAELGDYQIFMAIADNIGYDATGKDNTTLVEKKTKKIDGITKEIEIRRCDLFDEEIIYRISSKGEREKESSTILPKTGITGELKRFIEWIEENE